MRLWTVHPRFLDTKGLTALWREALLARAVLEGKTKGYRNHPQLVRFKRSADPQAYIGQYLHTVHHEATKRGYHFDSSKLSVEYGTGALPPMKETEGQLRYEWEHLHAKLKVRATSAHDKIALARLEAMGEPEAGPLFHIIPGPVRDWEKR